METAALDNAALDEALNAPEDEGTPAEDQQEAPQDQAEPAPQEDAEPAESAEPAEPATEQQEEPTDEEKAKLEKQLKDKEEFIQRRNQEVGELRKQLELLQTEMAKYNPEELNEKYYENPQEVVNQVLSQQRRQAEAERLERLAAVKQNEVVIKEFVPDFDDIMPDMVEIAKELKYPDEAISHFKANPYDYPAIVVNMAKAAKLAKENKALRAEVEQLRKRPDEVLKRVEAAARPTVTGNTGKTAQGGIGAKQVTQMTIAELDAALNEPD